MALTRGADHVGRVLGGRYRLLVPVGIGASATVFLADDVRLRRRVAVKLLHPALAGDQGFLRRFEAEARVAASLSHPNVMAVHDWGEDDGSPFLVTEYLGGGSLRGLLDGGHLLTPSQVLLVGLQAARGLEYAHRRGLVHRDVKPANLLFDDEGRLRIADFGLARALAEAAWTEPTGAVLGTARYAAPEQVRGAAVDGKADVYALAVVLVEAVSGRVPFAADSTLATLLARLDTPLAVPEELGPVRSVVEAAGRPDPSERPDAGEVAAAFDRVARDLPRPDPLPLVEAAAADEVARADRDPTHLAGPSVLAAPVSPPRAPGAATPAGPPTASSPSRWRPWRRWRGRGWRRPAWLGGPGRVAVSVVVLSALVAASVLGARAVLGAQLARHALPDLRGQPVAEASHRLALLKVRIDQIRRFDDKVAAGKVVDQRPAPGRRVRERSVVQLVVSRGATPVPVPDLAAATRADAAARLAAAGFALGSVTSQASETVVAGAVLDWSGKGGQLPRGSKVVDLVVSSGPPLVTVADVRNKPLADAIAALQAQGLVPVRTANGFDDNVAEGQVIATAPAGGTTAPKGSQVQVTVSKGPEFVSVPDVRDLAVDEATARLAQVHLGVAGTFGPQRKRALVLQTDPPPGARVHSGGSVNLYTH